MKHMENIEDLIMSFSSDTDQMEKKHRGDNVTL